MKIKKYSKTGEDKGQIDLSTDVFGVKPNVPLLTQYIYIYRTNQRQGTSKTKTKSEVSGGGKKPWQQKGTGRARQGSTRNPQWRHGGIAHGPIPKDWGLSFPKKMRVLAIKSALSLKVSKESIKALETVDIKRPSTSEMFNLLRKISAHGKVLFVQGQNNLVLRKSLSNLKNVRCSLVHNLNAYDILRANSIVLTEDSVKYLEEKYANK